MSKPELVQTPNGVIEVCRCGKDLTDCACAKGHECTCGGDPRLCGVQTVEINTLEIMKPR